MIALAKTTQTTKYKITKYWNKSVCEAYKSHENNTPHVNNRSHESSTSHENNRSHENKIEAKILRVPFVTQLFLFFKSV